MKDYAMRTQSHDLIEENLGDSDLEDDEKNKKIQAIKNSKILSQKINEQSTYLQTSQFMESPSRLS